MRMRVTIAVLGLVGAALWAAPSFGEGQPADAAPSQRAEETSAWAREQLARLSIEFEALKQQLAELGDRAGPALDRAREGIDAARDRIAAERPGLEAAGAELWEKTKAAAAALAADLRDTFERIEEKLSARR